MENQGTETDADGAPESDVAPDVLSGDAAPSRDIPSSRSPEAKDAARAEGISKEELEEMSGPELEALLDRQATMTVSGKPETRKVREWIQDGQKARGADDKFREAAKLRKDAEAQIAQFQQEKQNLAGFVEALSRPETIIQTLHHFGFPIEKAFQEWAASQAELDKLDPRERKLLEMEHKMHSLVQDREAERAMLESQRHQADVQAFQNQYMGWAESAMSEAGLTEEALGDVFPDVWEFMMTKVNRAFESGASAPTQELFKSAASVAAKYFKATGQAPPQQKALPPAPVRDGMVPKEKAGKHGSKKKRVSMDEFFEKLGEE